MAIPPPTSPKPAPRKRGAAALASLVPGTIEPVLRQRGFANATILTEWEAIAGANLARFTTPLELKWPRHRPEPDAPRQPRSAKVEKTEKAVLIVACTSAFALELQMGSVRLIEQINRRLGFDCIGTIQIRQGLPVKPVKPKPEPDDPAAIARLKAELQDIAHDPLREALATLGARIAANPRKGLRKT